MTEILEKPVKRLAALDAARGVAILAMLPFHLIFFAGFYSLSSFGTEFSAMSQAFPAPIDFRPPLGTGLLLFYFVTGVSLVASLYRGSKEKSIFTMWRRVIFRYGSYILLGILLEIIIYYSLLGSLFGTTVSFRDMIGNILGGLPASFSSPIQDLSFAAIISFPIIFYLSEKKLAIISLGLSLTVGLVLYGIFLPQSYTNPFPSQSYINPLIIGYFSVLKGIPLVLAGAVIGKLVIEGRDIKRKIILVGASITAAYIIIPALLGSGFMPMLLMIWAYPHALLFVLGSSLCLFGLFQTLEERKTKLGPLQALGRLSFIAYFGSFLFLLPTIKLISGFTTMNMGSLLVLMVISEIVIWPLCYYYSKWRWGNPSSW